MDITVTYVWLLYGSLQGARPCGLTQGEENAIMVIYCSNHGGLFIRMVKRGDRSLFDIKKRIVGD